MGKKVTLFLRLVLLWVAGAYIFAGISYILIPEKVFTLTHRPTASIEPTEPTWMSVTGLGMLSVAPALVWTALDASSDQVLLSRFVYAVSIPGLLAVPVYWHRMALSSLHRPIKDVVFPQILSSVALAATGAWFGVIKFPSKAKPNPVSIPLTMTCFIWGLVCLVGATAGYVNPNVGFELLYEGGKSERSLTWVRMSAASLAGLAFILLDIGWSGPARSQRMLIISIATTACAYSGLLLNTYHHLTDVPGVTLPPGMYTALALPAIVGLCHLVFCGCMAKTPVYVSQAVKKDVKGVKAKKDD